MSTWLSSFFILLFNSILIISNTNPISAHCPTDQQSLLLRIKAELVYNTTSSTKLANWNNNESLDDFCSWPGVKCLNRRVTELDLSSDYISGGFNSSSTIFCLKHLQKLNLGYNNFYSTAIPSKLGHLTTLTYLNLSNAGFVGQVPIQMSHLNQLVTLDLSTFSLLGIPSLRLRNPDLVSLVQNLTRLSALYLDGVDLSSAATTWCNVLSSSVPNLTALSLSDCNLLGPADATYSFAKLQSLSLLRLDNNDLSSMDPRAFARLSHLTTLSLVFCELKATFPEEVFQVKTLKTLDLSANPYLQGNLPQFLGNNSLQTLSLGNTNFSGTIPESVGELKMLSHLDLSQCNFHGLIPTQLRNLKNLVYIDLSSNRFNGPAQLFSSLVKLTALLLSSNQLTGSIAEANWTELVQLENLDMRNNSLNASIPSSLFVMPSLKKLLLSHNMFESLENVNLSVSSSILDTLDLSSNKLQGPCPAFIFTLPGIKILTLSFNNFSQDLDLSFIRQLKNLSSLDVSFSNLLIVEAKEVDFSLFPTLSTLKLASCKLKKFPDFLKYQSGLTYLDLSGNEIHGEIPKWIWDMSALSHLNLSHNYLEDFENLNLTIASLHVLDLGSNLLHGELPSLPPSASYMDFSRNNFSSKLPAKIGKYLSVTVFFSLANNLFKGTIPASICNAQYLQVLDLSNNSFEGLLPRCLVKMSQTLGVLNLRRNRFAGEISDSFKANCVLRTCDLSWNLIRGKLPKSLANCKALEVLNLGNNQIDDTFPCWLKNVSTLRVLILRSNMFHGSIGCPDTTRTWTMLQIVDLAFNNFNDTLSSDCLSTWKGMMTSNNDADSTNDHLKFKVLELGQLYYQDTVTVTVKGIQMEFIKLLTVFSSMDLSRNQLSGEIPDIIGNFTSLFVLNFSHNMFSGHIPASLGNLMQLESLDLSVNQLTGHIPHQLANLTFLSVLNLSYNQLEGPIPRGGQLDTFADSSYIGNKALCGPPLSNTPKCKMMPPSKRREARTSNSGRFDWLLILIGIGFGAGSATSLAPLVFWEKGKTWHDKQIDMLLSQILHWCGIRHLIHYDESDQKDEQRESDDASEDEREAGEALVTHEVFCLYCSKIDFTWKKVIHNANCRCHESPPSSFTSSSSSASPSLYQF